MAPAATVLQHEDKTNSASGALGKAKNGKKLRIRSYPKFESLIEERLYRKQHLAATFRVFAERGFDEGIAGHVSVRDPILTDHFCTVSPSHLTIRATQALTFNQGSTRCRCTFRRSPSRT